MIVTLLKGKTPLFHAELPPERVLSLGGNLYRVEIPKSLNRLTTQLDYRNKTIKIANGKILQRTDDLIIASVHYVPHTPLKPTPRKVSVTKKTKAIGESVNGEGAYFVGTNGFVFFSPTKATFTEKYCLNVAEKEFREQVRKGITRARLYEN